MKYLLLASLLFVNGCAITQKSSLRQGMTYHEMKEALSPTVLNYESGERTADGIKEVYTAESWPCWAESYSYVLVFVNGLLSKWTSRETITGDAMFVCVNGKTAISDEVIASVK